MFLIRHDPENGPLPAWADPSKVRTADFRNRAGAPYGEKCPRCGRFTNIHIWQAVDRDDETYKGQAGVIDCATKEV